MPARFLGFCRCLAYLSCLCRAAVKVFIWPYAMLSIFILLLFAACRGDALRDAYQKDPEAMPAVSQTQDGLQCSLCAVQAFEAADEALFSSRVAQLVQKLASVRAERVAAA